MISFFEVGIIIFLIIIQSVFGVGLLLFGTPSFLILGYDFANTINILMPVSITISILQFYKSKVKDQKTSKENTASALYKGCRIFHRKFGYGHVVDLHGDHVTINFEHTGYKKVISSFITAVDK